MSSVPKKIHQIFTKGYAALPQEIHHSIEALRRLNPDWEYHFYDEQGIQTYLREHYGQETLDVYEKINPQYGAARADFFRYLVMYKEGGVYLDIKSTCLRPFKEIIPDNCEVMLCQWDNRPGGQDRMCGKHKVLDFMEHGEYQQWNIFAAPHSPYLKSVVDEVTRRICHYKPWNDGIGMLGVLNTTGPVPFTLGIEKITKTETFYRIYDHRTLGLVYRDYAVDIMKFAGRRHYSALRSPVVTLHGNDLIKYRLWLSFIFPLWRLRKNIIKETTKIISRINKKRSPRTVV